MVDLKKVCAALDDSGLKRQHIADSLGISIQALRLKAKGDSPWTCSEAKALCDLLGISDPAIICNMFFA